MNTVWVFAAGMRRGGSTLQYHLARELVEYAGGFNAGWVTWQNFDKCFKKYDGSHPFVILKGHCYYPDHSDCARRLFDKGRIKALHIYRDIRDIAASYVQMRKKSIWDYILNTEIPSILREHELWIALPKEQIHITSYEKYMFGYEMELMKYFLEISMPPSELVYAMSRHTLESHKQLIATQEYDASNQRFNTNSLMWDNHIADGKVGKYKTVLTQEQIEQVETVAYDYLREKGYIDDNGQLYEGGHGDVPGDPASERTTG
jgi:hypothetical protein